MSDTPSLEDFEKTTDLNKRKIDIEQTNNKLVEMIPELDRHQADALIAALHKAGFLKEDYHITYDADFDIASEISQQLQMVKALREKIMVKGDLVAGVTVTEAQKVVTTCGSVISNLMRNHEKIQSMERHRAMEAAVVDALKELDNDELTETYFTLLRDKLEQIE